MKQPGRCTLCGQENRRDFHTGIQFRESAANKTMSSIGARTEAKVGVIGSPELTSSISRRPLRRKKSSGIYF
jgi:hypothetical protein